VRQWSQYCIRTPTSGYENEPTQREINDKIVGNS